MDKEGAYKKSAQKDQDIVKNINIKDEVLEQSHCSDESNLNTDQNLKVKTNKENAKTEKKYYGDANTGLDGTEKNIKDEIKDIKSVLLQPDKKSKEKIDDLTKQVKMLQDKLLRSMAEIENMRHMASKMMEEAKDYSITAFAKDLIPVIDNFTRALAYIPKNPSKEIESISTGIQMVKKDLEVAFTKHGLRSIVPKKGDIFDPNNHHAISQIKTTEYSAGSVMDVMQIGYKINNRLIRPASVTVVKQEYK